jgi:hypothetical protein
MSSTFIRYRACVCNWFRCKSMKKTCFDLEDRNERDAKDFENILKTFVLNDDKFVSDSRFFYLEYMSNRRFVNESWANHECVQHSNLAINDISCERRHFCENHELLYHLLLTFSYVWISFQTNVDQNFQNSYIDFDYIVLDSILIVIVMSNFFEFLIKWINSYLIETNKNSCRVAHFSQSLCTRFKFLQFSFVLLS